MEGYFSAAFVSAGTCVLEPHRGRH